MIEADSEMTAGNADSKSNPREVICRERINNPVYGQYWEKTEIGPLLGFGISNGESIAIVEVRCLQELTTRDLDAQEKAVRYLEKRYIKHFPLSSSLIVFSGR